MKKPSTRKRYPTRFTNFTKVEIVVLHMTLFYLKSFFESTGFSNQFISRVFPSHIHFDKHKHITAISLLSKGILSIINPNQLSLLISPQKSQKKELSHLLTELVID